jgi:hypothetical protein
MMEYSVSILCKADDFDAKFDAVNRLMTYWAKISLMRHIGEAFVLTINETRGVSLNFPNGAPENIAILDPIDPEKIGDGDSTLYTMTAHNLEDSGQDIADVAKIIIKLTEKAERETSDTGKFHSFIRSIVSGILYAADIDDMGGCPLCQS